MSEATHAEQRTSLSGSAPSVAQGALPSVLASRPLRCSARGIEKRFGSTPILRGVDLDIPEGAFAVLVGPSGCGKSTLLRLVAGLESADAGSIMLRGRDVTRLPPRERDVAMVFQSYALYPHLTVRENLAFGLELRRVPRDEITSRIGEASIMLGLEPLLDRFPKQLSGGQRQRVAMGRAIVRRPNLFLFDEPLSNLDAALRAEVRVDIRKLHDRLGATTLYVTHDQVEAMTLADTLWVLNGGKVEQKGPPLDIYEHPKTLFVARFLGSPPMNVFEGRLENEHDQWFATSDGFRAKVDAHALGSIPASGASVTIGVRPHDVTRAAPGEEHVAEVVVDVVEALGFEAFAHGTLRSSATRVIVRLDANDAKQVRVGDVIALAAPRSRIHLFDTVSGRTIAA